MNEAAVDVSVECAHIYTNGHIGEEHHLSLRVLSRLREQGLLATDATSLVVLVDDLLLPGPDLRLRRLHNVAGRDLAPAGFVRSSFRCDA